jgi:hypothetical protein
MCVSVASIANLLPSCVVVLSSKGVARVFDGRVKRLSVQLAAMAPALQPMSGAMGTRVAARALEVDRAGVTLDTDSGESDSDPLAHAIVAVCE